VKSSSQYLKIVDPNYKIIKGSSKHRYLMPLDDAMRKQIAPLAKPYPKRQSCVSSIGSDATGDQPEEGGAAPTDTLTKTSETKSNL
jgi:hypothetical protein